MKGLKTGKRKISKNFSERIKTFNLFFHLLGVFHQAVFGVKCMRRAGRKLLVQAKLSQNPAMSKVRRGMGSFYLTKDNYRNPLRKSFFEKVRLKSFLSGYEISLPNISQQNYETLLLACFCCSRSNWNCHGALVLWKTKEHMQRSLR